MFITEYSGHFSKHKLINSGNPKLIFFQLNVLLYHQDSPYIRGVGLLYIRYTQAPEDLFTWFEPFLDDEEVCEGIVPFDNATHLINRVSLLTTCKKGVSLPQMTLMTCLCKLLLVALSLKRLASARFHIWVVYALVWVLRNNYVYQ